MHSTKLTCILHSLFLNVPVSVSVCVCLNYCCFTSPERKSNSSSSTTCALTRYRAHTRTCYFLRFFFFLLSQAHQGDRVFSVPIYVCFTTYRFLYFLLLTPTLFTIFSSLISAYETRNMYRIIPHVEKNGRFAHIALVFYGNLNTFNTNYNFIFFFRCCCFSSSSSLEWWMRVDCRWTN